MEEGPRNTRIPEVSTSESSDKSNVRSLESYRQRRLSENPSNGMLDTIDTDKCDTEASKLVFPKK